MRLEERFSRIPWWIRSALGLALFAPLVIVPIDLPTMLLWGPAGLILFVVLLPVPVELYRWRAAPRSVSTFPIGRLSMLAIFVGALLLQRASRSAADRFGHETALSIQEQCRAVAACPPTLPGWECEDAPRQVCATAAGAFGSRFSVLYFPNRDRQQFSISVRHDIDDWKTFVGGVDRELR